jgi:hypothetical protein
MDISKPIFAIINEFDLAAHVARMRNAHPEWSRHQLTCCLYWQARARKALGEKIAEFNFAHTGLFIDMCPEANGVNVTQTLRHVGINLEWPPIHIARQVAIAGTPLPREAYVLT